MNDGSSLWLRHFTGPAIRIPLFFDLTEGDYEGFGVFSLDIIPAIVKNINHGIIFQSQHRAGVERETMLDGDLDTDLRDDGLGLLQSHNARPLTLIFGLRGVNLVFTLLSGRFFRVPSKKVLTAL